jgi:hypothetical protein
MAGFWALLYIWFLLLIIVLLGWMYMMIWRAGVHSFRMLLISFGASKRRGLDISKLKPVPPDNLRPNITALENLGFRRLGETQTELPTFSSPIRSWIFISSDGLTYAGVAEVQPKRFNWIQFSTVYSDNAALETDFPIGEKINTPTLRSHTITTDIEKAYQHHIQQITDFGKIHSHPRIIKNMEDYHEWDGLYCKRRLLRMDLGNLTQFISLVYSIVITLAVIILYIYLYILTGDGPYNLIISLFLAIAPAIFITYVSARTMVSMSRRESKST